MFLKWKQIYISSIAMVFSNKETIRLLMSVKTNDSNIWPVEFENIFRERHDSLVTYK